MKMAAEGSSDTRTSDGVKEPLLQEQLDDDEEEELIEKDYLKVLVRNGVVVDDDDDGNDDDDDGNVLGGTTTDNTMPSNTLTVTTTRRRVKGHGEADEDVNDSITKNRLNGELMKKDGGDVFINKDDDNDDETREKSKHILLLIKLVVFIDFLGVAVLVPLLSSYFRDLHVSIEMFGLVSSCYSAAQIIGGLVFGTLSDHALSRRTVLLISFLGSMISYGVVGVSTSLPMLLCGRVLVGLVKQTMTVTTAIISEHTKPGSGRSKELSHHTAAATISFIVGPSLGSFLYKHSKALPPLVSSGMFLANSVLVLLFLPGGISRKKREGAHSHCDANKSQANNQTDTLTTRLMGPFKIFYNNFVFTCTRGSCMRIVSAKLLSALLLRSLSPSMFVGYFEERYNMESHVLGYISSYRATLSLLVTIYIIPKVTIQTTETRLVGLALLGITLGYIAEASSAMLVVYLTVVVPFSCIARSTLDVCLKSLFTQRTRQEEMGAALGTMNVLTAVVGVIAPLYGGELFGHLGVAMRPLAAAAHYFVFLILWVMWEMRGEEHDERMNVVNKESISTGADKAKVE